MSNQIRLRGSQGQYNPSGLGGSSGGTPVVMVAAPSASSDPGEEGQVAEDGSYFYVYSAILGAWTRTAISDWS